MYEWHDITVMKLYVQCLHTRLTVQDESKFTYNIKNQLQSKKKLLRTNKSAFLTLAFSMLLP